ncbi:MAG TPA: UbiD family decarboxylase, partial [Pirellulaceae bacterium]|nr:UbiD family decarboxylase [Pirellulaceae bacterium]
MGYRNLAQCVADLERAGHLVRLDEPVDARLEAAEIHRRVQASGGPAILFTRVRDNRFTMVSNLFGTLERGRFLFRDRLEAVRRAIELKIDPMAALKRPFRYLGAARTAWSMRPKRVRSAPILRGNCRVRDLPYLQSWPMDGGPFVTLPQVYTESPSKPGWSGSNLGMYRIQLQGNDYLPDTEIGLHYQLHRGIGVHHREALLRNEPLRV